MTTLLLYITQYVKELSNMFGLLEVFLFRARTAAQNITLEIWFCKWKILVLFHIDILGSIH